MGGHVTIMGETRNAQKEFGAETSWRSPLERPRIWENSIKMSLTDSIKTIFHKQ